MTLGVTYPPGCMFVLGVFGAGIRLDPRHSDVTVAVVVGISSDRRAAVRAERHVATRPPLVGRAAQRLTSRSQNVLARWIAKAVTTSVHAVPAHCWHWCWGWDEGKRGVTYAKHGFLGCAHAIAIAEHRCSTTKGYSMPTVTGRTGRSNCLRRRSL